MSAPVLPHEFADPPQFVTGTASAKWAFFPFGEDQSYAFHLSTAPCAFHRWAQRMVFGFKWEKLP
jgi:hypothetical protein